MNYKSYFVIFLFHTDNDCWKTGESGEEVCTFWNKLILANLYTYLYTLYTYIFVIKLITQSNIFTFLFLLKTSHPITQRFVEDDVVTSQYDPDQHRSHEPGDSHDDKPLPRP